MMVPTTYSDLPYFDLPPRPPISGTLVISWVVALGINVALLIALAATAWRLI
ncbi:MAG TPA: hypothetical protein VKW08_08065 [Xanthobacteraceae bacterium]|jgi:hypothetical protein|nr:hypothetical protein [Xanthobacteraceae bacterium]